MLSLIRLVRVAIAFAPFVSIVAGSPARRQSIPSLAEATTEELAAGLDAKLFTSVDLVNVGIPILYMLRTANMCHCKAYIERVLEVNSTLHAVVELNPDAVAIAEALDEERACGKLRG
jgi:amidase